MFVCPMRSTLALFAFGMAWATTTYMPTRGLIKLSDPGTMLPICALVHHSVGTASLPWSMSNAGICACIGQARPTLWLTFSAPMS